MGQVIKTGQWATARRAFGARRMIHSSIDRAVGREALRWRKAVVEGMRDQAPGGKPFKPLAATTLAMRRFQGFRGTKALIRSGDLIGSITVTQTGLTAFVGVLRTARGRRSGRPMVNIAEVQEFGSPPIVIRMTSRMRAFLHLAFREAGLARPATTRPSTGIIIVQIPPRPYLRPVRDVMVPGSRERMRKDIAAGLGGLWGR